MKKLFVKDNYIVVNDRVFPTIHTTHSEDNVKFVIEERGTNDKYQILISDIGNWYNEAGDTAFTEATMRTFLRANTGKSANDGVDGVDGEDATNDYSTTETVIGTWTDGKPIYRKVGVVESSRTNPGAFTNALNIKNLISFSGHFTLNGKNYPVNINGMITYNSLEKVGMRIDTGEGYVRFLIVNTDASGVETIPSTIDGYVFILEYTKTTD